jgi:hypothetical protein
VHCASRTAHCLYKWLMYLFPNHGQMWNAPKISLDIPRRLFQPYKRCMATSWTHQFHRRCLTGSAHWTRLSSSHRWEASGAGGSRRLEVAVRWLPSPLLRNMYCYGVCI